METTNGLHRSDTIEEKMSLVNRFGCQICYSKPSNKEYYDIVIGLARKSGLDMTDEELMAEAIIVLVCSAVIRDLRMVLKG